MAINFVSDGTITGSVSVASPDLSLQYPALPEDQRLIGRDLTYMTEAGFFHAYRLAQPTRSFQIGCRLITTTQLEQLMHFYSVVTERHWFTWQLATGTAEAGTSVTMDDNGLTYNFSNEHRDCVIFLVSGTGVGQRRRITASSTQSGGTRLTFAAMSPAPSSDTVYILGWPVRIVGGVSRQAYGNNLYNADFTVEEVILTDTV